MSLITVVIPSVRYDALEVVRKCLHRQTFNNFETIVVSPFKYGPCDMWVQDPPKREGDYYSLNKAWNKAFKRAFGKLIVSIVDGIWFPPDTLEKLWKHYEDNPLSCVTTIGHQYDRIENGKPEHLVWRDPRAREDQGSYYEVSHMEMELCVASFPKQAVLDVGGVDEEFDRFAAISEKEMMARMYKAGYKTYIDQTIEYRALQHPRLSKEWDTRYQAGLPYFETCLRAIQEGKRLKLNNGFRDS